MLKSALFFLYIYGDFSNHTPGVQSQLLDNGSTHAAGDGVDI